LTGQRFCHSVRSIGSSGPSSRAAPYRAGGVNPAPALRLVPQTKTIARAWGVIQA
jgi:hypothetical protein